MERPDPADVRAAAAGDTAAFERIVRGMQATVWRYLVHLLGDAALAEDVAQDVFVRVHGKLKTLRDPERFVPWLLTMARNAAYDAGRSRRRRPLTLVGDDELPAVASDPHLETDLREALSRLEPELREALMLVTLVGFTYDEAGDVLAIPAGTVKSRVFRARRALLDLLDLPNGETGG